MSTRESIRPGTRDDVALLGDIERAAGRLFPAGRIPDPAHTYPQNLLEQAADDGLLLIAEVDGLAVGFAVCSRAGDRLHLDELSVHPDHGRRGYGRALVQRVIEMAASRGLEGVSLTTFADIPWNAPFYVSMGFEPVPEDGLDQLLADSLAAEREAGLAERLAMFRAV